MFTAVTWRYVDVLYGVDKFVNSLYSNYLLAYPAALSAGHRSADMTEWSLNNKLSSRGFGLVFHCFVV